MYSYISRPFTLKSVLEQLRYRYDVEIIEGKRSVIRKITEQDDILGKTMCLYVAAITSVGLDRTVITVTDGWYSLRK